MGARTWGGEIWLSQNNFLVDRGIATAAETGVYGPEGQWLIEGHGVDPDIVIDNLPHETFGGKDAQLDAAVRHLQELISRSRSLCRRRRPTQSSGDGGGLWRPRRADAKAGVARWRIARLLGGVAAAVLGASRAEAPAAGRRRSRTS